MDGEVSAFVLGINANKRSLTLDLTKPGAVDIVKKTGERADVVWENFRPGSWSGSGSATTC